MATTKMDKTVAELNIEHYRKLLASDIDETKRTTVERLLATEENKLTQIMSERAATSSRQQWPPAGRRS